jgi:hypothetical protein
LFDDGERVPGAHYKTIARDSETKGLRGRNILPSQ